MLKYKKFKMPITLFLGISLLGSTIFYKTANAEVAVVVNTSNTSTFDKSKIKKIFLGKTKSFENGRAAILLSPKPDSATREQFNKLVLGKTSNQINAYWSKMIFTGKGIPPQEMKSDSELIESIAANKDTIGYIDAASVTDAVKVVAKFK